MIDATTTLFFRFRTWGIAGVSVLALALFVVGCDAFTSQDLGDSNKQKPTIKQYVEEVRALSSLEEVTTKAGLMSALEEDDITVFAPTDGAFAPENFDKSDLLADANSDLLTEVLQYHIVPQAVKLREGDDPILADGADSGSATFTTVEGDELRVRVTSGSATVNGVPISNGDADASNGVVHVTDGVLLESTDVVDRAELTPAFRILRRLIGETGLEGVLRGERPGPNPREDLTVFAPTNAAFVSALDQNGNGQIEEDEIPDNADDILEYHVIGDVFRVEDIPTSPTNVETLEGSDVTVQRFPKDSAPDSVTVNGNPVTIPDARVENGVVHGIGTVLTP